MTWGMSRFMNLDRPTNDMEGSINGDPQNGRFIMETPIKIDDLGVPPFQDAPICLFPQNHG